jgi:hypothetical protein
MFIELLYKPDINKIIEYGKRFNKLNLIEQGELCYLIGLQK